MPCGGMAKPSAWPPKPIAGRHNLRLVFDLGQPLQICGDVLPVHSPALAGYDRLYIQHVARPEREELRTIKSSAEQVRKTAVASNSNGLDRRTKPSSKGSAASAISIGTPSGDCSSRTRFRRANSRGSEIRPAYPESNSGAETSSSHPNGQSSVRSTPLVNRGSPQRITEASDETESPAMRLEQLLKIAGRVE